MTKTLITNITYETCLVNNNFLFKKLIDFYDKNSCKLFIEKENWAFVALLDDLLIGGINGEIKENTLKIKYLFVLPIFRNCGVGSKLLEDAINYAKHLNFKSITLNCLEFQHPLFWEKRGFVEECNLFINDQSIVEYFYKLKL